MKMYHRGAIALCLLVFLACSKDDGGSEVDTNGPSIDFTLVGEDTERVYQYSYNSVSETESQADLTQELGLSISYVAIREDGDVLSFYFFDSGNFSLIQKNIVTGVSSKASNFYAETVERAVLWGTNTSESVYMGYFKPSGSSNLGLLTIDIASGAQTELLIEDAIQNAYEPIYHKGKLLLTYRDALGNYTIAVVDTTTNTLQKKLEFGEFIPNVFLDSSGDVVILKSEQGENYSYAIYDSESFEPTESRDFSLKRFFNAGALGARLIGQKLIYFSPLVQPAAVQFGPASFDLSDDTETLLDMENIVNRVEREKGMGIQLISQGYDEGSGSYLIGYVNLNGGIILEGGVLIVSFDGELVNNIELSFVPTYFLSDD